MPALPRLGLLALLASMLAGCPGTARLDSAEAGRTRVFEPGLPNFDLDAVATLSGGGPQLDVLLGVPRASLVFVPRAGGFEARAEALVRLYDERGKALLSEHALADTLRAAGYAETQTFEAALLRKRLPVEPGTYVLAVTLTDLESAQTAERRLRVEVPSGQVPALGRLRLDARRGGRPFAPLLALNVPAGFDSLRAAVELFQFQDLAQAEVTLRLLRIPADTTVAEAPYRFTPTALFRPLRYEAPETLQVSRRALAPLGAPGPVLDVQFDLPRLGPGMYRIEVEAHDGRAAPLRRQRDLAVRRPSFPRLATLDAMVEALVYLARRREMDDLRRAADPAERRRRFDAFWATLVPDRARAANLLELYFSRVEEANLRYTTYKEGWKTDRGMVFIILGHPLYVEHELDAEVWRYSYDERDPLHAFTFTRRRLVGTDGLFEAYLLERQFFHENAWRRALDRWRRGEVL